MRVISTGAPSHGKSFANALSLEFYEPSLPLSWCHFEDLVFVGMFPFELNLLFNMSFRKQKLFPIFIGSDVLSLIQLKKRDEESFSHRVALINSITETSRGRIIAVSPNLASELDSLGIHRVLTLPLVPPPNSKLLPWDEGERKYVGMYIPLGAFKHTLFNMQYSTQFLDQNVDHIMYLVAESALSQCPPPTPKVSYTSNFEEWANSIYCNVRLTYHDGLPQSVVALGRCGIPTITLDKNLQFLQGTKLGIPTDSMGDASSNRADRAFKKALKYVAKMPQKDRDKMLKYYKDTFTYSQMITNYSNLFKEFKCTLQ